MALPALQTTLKDWAVEVAKGNVVDHRAAAWSGQLSGKWWARECQLTVPLYPDKQTYMLTMHVITSADCELVMNNGWTWRCAKGTTIVPLRCPLPLEQAWQIHCRWKGAWWRPWQHCHINVELLIAP